MHREAQNNGYIIANTLALSVSVVFLLFLWQGNKGFSLWDEGFLWYGVQRVLLGEVPIRDFMAYDPGRYYWSAVFVNVVADNGIMSLRAAAALIQALGLFVGLLLIAQSTNRSGKDQLLYLIISATTLVVWMFPRHKLFDISLSIMLISILTFLITNPVPKRYFIAGTCVGLVAVFGRNHGMYGMIGSAGVMVWLSIKRSAGPTILHGAFLWGAGVTVGFLPIIFMALLIPGFAVAFWESILLLFEQQTTNLPLPVPWPWTVNFAAASLEASARGVLVGLFFIGTLVFAGLSVLWVLLRRLKEKPVPASFVATAFLALPYAHFAFSRADVAHLAQGIFPIIVGCLIILSGVKNSIKWPLAAGLCITSVWVMHTFHPGWQCLASKQCIDVEIYDSNLKVDPGTAKDIALLHELTEQYAPNDQSFIATPYWPGAYALLKRKSPMWEIYALFPRTEAFQRKEIERIKEFNSGFAIVIDLPLDGRDELRFKNTHPLIHNYIVNNFELVPVSPQPAYQIYKAKRR